MNTFTIISIALISLGILFGIIDFIKIKKQGSKINTTTYLLFIVAVVLLGMFYFATYQTEKDINEATELVKNANINMDKSLLRGKEIGRVAMLEFVLRKQKDTTLVFSEEYIIAIEDSIEKSGYPFKENN